MSESRNNSRLQAAGRRTRRRRYPDWDWDAVDWTRPYDEIARDLGCSPATVYKAKFLHAPEGVKPRRREYHRKSKYEGVDWSRSDAAIARSLHVTRAAVYQARRKLSPETFSGRRSCKHDWAAVDWSQSDKVIAARLGISRSQANYHRHVHTRERSAKAPSRYDTVDWTRRDVDIARELRVSRQSVHAQRIRMAPETLPRRRTGRAGR